jgi:CRISPR/Cas system-associated exonuclease Cas4 (RecB family)
VELQLSKLQDDERAGFPSASEFSRLMKCRASFLLSKKAQELGQVAHERSEAALLGTKKHLANIEGPEILVPRERADWELCQRKREAFLKSWTGGSDSPVQSVLEERLWLRKGIRPLLSGKPDEVLRQGTRACVLDHKYGIYRVEDPQENLQLGVYALLVSHADETTQEVTCQILSPYWDFEPVVYSREELDRLYQSVLVVVASLNDPGNPVPGDHCHFCPARLICQAAKEAATQAIEISVNQLPLGTGAAELLDQIKRAQTLFKEIESYYKRLLEETPGAIPGWMLEPGDIRRSIEDAVALHAAGLFSAEELLSCCSLSVPALERTWAAKNGVATKEARAPFKKFLGTLLTEKRTTPSLRRIREPITIGAKPGTDEVTYGTIPTGKYGTEVFA